MSWVERKENAQFTRNSKGSAGLHIDNFKVKIYKGQSLFCNNGSFIMLPYRIGISAGIDGVAVDGFGCSISVWFV